MPYFPKAAGQRDQDAQLGLGNIVRWAEEEFQNIARSMSETLELELRTTYKAPVRPKNGMIVHADGTSWNPGSGAGLYLYYNGWVLISSGASTVASVSNTVTSALYVQDDSSRMLLTQLLAELKTLNYLIAGAYDTTPNVEQIRVMLLKEES